MRRRPRRHPARRVGLRFAAPLLVLLLAAAIPAQQPAEPDFPPALRELAVAFGPPGEAATLRTPAIDAPSLAAAASAASVSSASTDGGFAPFRFAEPFDVGATPAGLGEWRTSLDGGTAVWRLRIVSEGAVSLNLGFTRYRMPTGGRLYVYTPGFGEVIGPYTGADNESHGQLWTPLLPGDEAVVVVELPADRAAELVLELASVNRGFRALADVVSASHQSCQVNVACSEADPYRDQVRSVGWYTVRGTRLCSGVLLNNTSGDGKLYFLSAEHCIGSILRDGKTEEWVAAGVVAYWNDETTTCSGSTARFDPRQSQSGAWFRARWKSAGGRGTDVLLFELDDPPDPSHNLYLAGWERRLPASGPVFGIHHPSSHFKSISIMDGTPWPTPRQSYRTDENDRYLRVAWNGNGPERGSSGSPLFNARKRVVGQSYSIEWYSGESPFCRAPGESRKVAWYGRFDRSWDRISAWLDPGGTDAAAIDGRNASVTLSPMRLKVPEDGSATYTVAPASEPDEDEDDLVITLSVPGGTDVSASPASLTFTTDNWDTAQTVTVSAADDDDNLRDDPVSIGHAAAGGGYDAASVDDLVALVGENDPGVEISESALSISECLPATYTVGLVSAPSADAVVSLTLPADAAFSASASSLTFTTENWETARTVTLTTDDDADPPPAASIAHSVSGGGYDAVSIAGVSVTVEETTVGSFSVRPASLSLAEGGTGSYTVRLTSAPVTEVTLSATPLADVPVSIAPSSLTFTPENWETARTVTVTAHDDADAVAPPPAAIGHSAAGCGYDALSIAGVSVTVTESDVAGVTVRPTSLSLREGRTGRYTVELTSQPTADVTVSIDAPAGADVSVDASSLTFTASTWDVEQTVTVTAEEDDDTVSDPRATIHHGVSGGDYGSVSASSVTATILENDASALSLSDVSGSESSSELVFTVTISEAGTSDVTVDYATSNGTALAGSDYTSTSGTLKFPQGSTSSLTIAVPLRDDAADEEEEETFRLTLSNVHNGLLAGGGSTLRVTGTIEDDDDPAVTVSFGNSNYPVTEGGSARVVVRLDKDPERTVTVPLESTARGGVSQADYSGLPDGVTFGPGEQSVDFLFSATDDDEDDDGEAVELSFGSFLPNRVTAGRPTVLAINDNDDGGTPPPPPGGGPPPPPPDDDEDDDGGGGGGGGLTPPRAAIRTDAECADGLCRAVTGSPVRFEDASTGSVQRRTWDFGQGSSRSATVNRSWSVPGFHEVTLQVSGGEHESTASLVFLVEASEPAGTCVARAETLCLQDSRFSVGVEWWTASGERGAGFVVRRGTNDSGLFSFFGDGNWEMLVKVLDGCALNGHVWVFGALPTDLGYRVAVTDTVTGAVREYRNEPDSPAPAITDATAFQVCAR